MATLKLRKLPGKSIETQILNTYREGFFNYLIGTGTFYKIRDQYLELFDKCFNTKNIMSYPSMKITQIKTVLDHFARDKKIEINTENL